MTTSTEPSPRASRLIDNVALEAIEPGTYRHIVNDKYWIIGGPNGGYLAAILAHAGDVELAEPERQLRSLTTHYLRPPALGPADVSVEVVQRGRSVAWLRLRLEQNGKPILLATGAWAGGRASSITAPVLARPDSPPPEACHPIESVRTEPLNLHEQWEIRSTDPEVHRRSDGTPDQLWWIRPRVHAALDAPTVVAITDALPPPIFSTIDGMAAVPTIDLTVHTRADLAAVAWAEGDWILGHFTTRHAADGFLEEDGHLWLADGTLIANSRQLAIAG